METVWLVLLGVAIIVRLVLLERRLARLEDKLDRLIERIEDEPLGLVEDKINQLIETLARIERH